MADIFDFNEEDEDCCSSASPKKKRPQSLGPPPKSPPIFEAEASTLQPPLKGSTLTATTYNGRTPNPLFAGGRTRHARNLKRHVEDLESRQKEAPNWKGEEFSFPAEKKELAKKRKTTKKRKKADSDEDDDSTSTASLSIQSKGNQVVPRRKRRRKQTAINYGKRLVRPARDSRTVSGSGITDSLSPFGPTSSSSLSPNVATSISQQIQQKLQQHERQQNKLCPSPSAVVSRKIGGAGRNVFAVQDAGKHQMIHDECAELTSTILACPKEKILARGVIVETVSELAVMLSCTKSRRMLWQTAEDDSNCTSRNKTLAGILDVLHHATTALSEKIKLPNERWLSLLKKLQPAGTKPTPFVPQQQPQHNIVESYYAGLLLDSLVAVVSFLSWDTTIEHKNSVYHKNASGARLLRKAILQHDGMLCVIMHLIRHADPILSSILEAKAATMIYAFQDDHALECTPHTSNGCKAKPLRVLPKAKLRCNTSNNCRDSNALQEEPESQVGGFSEESELSDSAKPRLGHATSTEPQGSFSQSSVASTASSQGFDPTVAGRRKRRRKKGGHVLQPIAEDSFSFAGNTTTGTATPPRSPPRVVFRQNEAPSDGRTKLSFQSADTFSPSRSPKPRRGASRQDDDEGSSIVSCDSALLKVHELLGQARAKFILAPSQMATKPHECQAYRELHLAFGGKDPAGSASIMALNSLHRLLAGKEEGDSHSCLDELEEDSSERTHNQRGDFMSKDETMEGKPEDDELLRSNPLLQTNRLIGDSGVIPFLAQGMAETLTALIEELDEEASAKPCQSCLQHLHDKLLALAPVVDNSCLLHSANRTDFCAATMASAVEDEDEDESDDSMLVGSLVLFLKHWSREKMHINGNNSKQGLETLLNEVGLSALRTLTSLTHDNVLSAEQFAIRYRENLRACHDATTPCKLMPSWNGVQVVGQVLHKAATDASVDSSKIAYDTCIFCLNTLANVVGEDSDGEIRRILVAMKLPKPGGKKKSVHFLSWLTKWLVGQTESFRDAIMKGSFGVENGKTGANQQYSDRELEKHEHEQLVTAGNGCVLLACLLMEPSMTSSARDQKTLVNVIQNIREIILSDMPLDDDSGHPTGTTFLKNTLRAFANFLYFSVGHLSVAVVAPVRKLISELEKMEVDVVS